MKELNKALIWIGIGMLISMNFWGIIAIMAGIFVRRFS